MHSHEKRVEVALILSDTRDKLKQNKVREKEGNYRLIKLQYSKKI